MTKEQISKRVDQVCPHMHSFFRVSFVRKPTFQLASGTRKFLLNFLRQYVTPSNSDLLSPSRAGVAKLCGAALAGGVLGLWALGSLRSARPGFQLRFGAAYVGREANISIESTAVLRVDPIHVPETDMGEADHQIFVVFLLVGFSHFEKFLRDQVSWLWVALLAVMVALAAVMYHCASKLEANVAGVL